MKKNIIGWALLAALFAIPALIITTNAQNYVSVTDDQSTAFRVYNGTTGTVVLGIVAAGASATNTFVVNGQYNAIDGSADTDTIAEFVTALKAATNASGVAVANLPIVIDSNSSLGTDSTDGELLTATYTIAAGESANVLYDTSGTAMGRWDIYIPKADVYSRYFGDMPVPVSIKGLYASGGTSTGAVTVSVYRDGTLAWAKAASDTTGLTLGDSTMYLPLSPNSAYIIRSDPAGVAGTGGVLGITTE